MDYQQLSIEPSTLTLHSLPHPTSYCQRPLTALKIQVFNSNVLDSTHDRKFITSDVAFTKVSNSTTVLRVPWREVITDDTSDGNPSNPGDRGVLFRLSAVTASELCVRDSTQYYYLQPNSKKLYS